MVCQSASVPDVAAPKPFLIKAKFRACLDPLGCAEFPFEIRDDAKPEIPNPLEAVSIRHPHPLMKSSGPPIQSVWPLDVDSGTRILGVSPDGLIDITFRRQVSNATSSFVSGDAFEDKWHAVGQISGYRYQYRVTAIRLFDEAGGTTSEVAAAPLVATHGAWSAHHQSTLCWRSALQLHFQAHLIASLMSHATIQD